MIQKIFIGNLMWDICLQVMIIAIIFLLRYYLIDILIFFMILEYLS